jgi:hypothetical protein
MMGNLRFVENDRVFKLARIAQDAAGTHNHILADVAAIADFASFADPCRSFDHGALLDDRALPDEHGAADEGLSNEAPLDRRLEPKLKVAVDLLESVPHVGGAFKKHPVLGVVQVKIIGGRKHERLEN